MKHCSTCNDTGKVKLLSGWARCYDCGPKHFEPTEAPVDMNEEFDKMFRDFFSKPSTGAKGF